MSKKWAILITVVGISLIYLFLLVGVPALEEMVGVCGSMDLVGTDNDSAFSNVTANWEIIGPAIDTRPYSERLKMPWLLYSVPGLVFIVVVVVILNQKKEVKTDE